MSYTIPLFDANFDEHEAEAVAATVRSKWVSMGRNVAELEARFAERLGVRHVVAVTNCTAALHLAMVLAGLREGDEVLVPSLTFVATVNAVRYVGATPVFVDVVGDHDLGLDPADAAGKVTDRTRAVIPMHYGGFPASMDAIGALAENHNLTVIEDAAHAIDVSYHGRKLGTIGRLGCFSLFSNKVITSAEGGFITTDDDELAARARVLRSHGMTSLSYDRARGHATRYDVVGLGYNYRMDDIRGALALAQLDKLDRTLARRRELRGLYERELAEVSGIVVPYVGSGQESAHYILPVVLAAGDEARREAVRDQMKDRGVQTSVHYPPAHRFGLYADLPAEVPVTDVVADREITLPLYDALEEEQVRFVVRCLAEALEEHPA